MDKGTTYSYAKNTAWLFTNQIISGLAILALSIVVARYIDKNTYGSYKYIVAAVSLVGTIGLSGVGVAIMRSTARGYEASLLAGTKLYLRYSWLSIVIAIIGGSYYLTKGNLIFGWLFMIGGLIYPLFVATQFYNGYLVALQKFKLATLYNSPASVVASTVLIAVAIFAPTTSALIIAYFVGSIICHGYYLLRTIKAHDRTENELANQNLATDAKHNSANNLISAIVGNLDKVIVFQFVGATELAIYIFATTIPDFIKAFSKSINTLFFASISQSTDRDHLKKLGLTSLIGAMAAAGLIAIIYAIGAPFIFKLLYPTYLEAVSPSRLYSLTVIITAFQLGVATIIQARGQNKLLYKTNLYSSAVQLACLVAVLTVTPTIIGIILARIIGQTLGSLITGWLVFKKINLN